jgi:hypothetical protein
MANAPLSGGTGRGLKDDLPDGTSENDCDTLARRANHFVIPEAARGYPNPFVKTASGKMDCGPAPSAQRRRRPKLRPTA